MTKETINIITNILAVVLVFVEPLHAYFAAGSFNVGTFIVAVCAAVIAYFTGKS